MSTEKTPAAPGAKRNRHRREQRRYNETSGLLYTNTERLLGAIHRKTRSERRSLLLLAGIQDPKEHTKDGRAGNIARAIAIIAQDPKAASRRAQMLAMDATKAEAAVKATGKEA